MEKPTYIPTGEKLVRRIGGALASDYYSLREMIANINADYSPLFDLMEFNSPEHTDRAIDILLGNSLSRSAKEEYIDFWEEKVASGELKVEQILSKRLLNKEYPTPEDKEKEYKREIHRAISRRYTEIDKCFRKKYGYMQRRYNRLPLKICREALSLVPGGFIIDADKFIEIYGDFLEAHNSQIGKQHLEAAEAINRFFNGKVEVTEKELQKYFIIEDGVLKPNPKSITSQNYMRLGYRGEPTTDKI